MYQKAMQNVLVTMVIFPAVKSFFIITKQMDKETKQDWQKKGKMMKISLDLLIICVKLWWWICNKFQRNSSYKTET